MGLHWGEAADQREQEDTVEPATLYVAGYGRSGSTVLATVLGTHPLLHSAGELGFVTEEWQISGRTCSCGLKYIECDFWGDLVRSKTHLWKHSSRASRHFEGRLSLLRFPLGIWSRQLQKAYQEAQTTVMTHVREVSGKPIIVDSSKTARRMAARPVALSRLCGEQVYVVHLVRDGRATLSSFIATGSNWQLEGRDGRDEAGGVSSLRIVAGWALANLTAMLYRFALGRDRYVRLKFEDLAMDPGGSLQRVGALLNMDVTPLLDRLSNGATFKPYHMTGGNRIRYSGAISLDSTKAMAPGQGREAWRGFLPCLVGSWMNRILGYRR